MFFHSLNEIGNGRIYSIAQICVQKDHNMYSIRDDDVYFIVYTHEKLNPGEWIRFVGTLYSKNINLEYVEVLHNTDIRLMKKCISLLKEI